MKRILSLILVVSFVLPLSVLPAAAERGMRLIRDAEIENTIRLYTTPLFTTAGLDPSAIRIYLIDNRQLNAFVAGGQNIFIHTGLLIRSEHAGQVIGVLAHETGHIAGGHLTRLDDAMRRAQIQSIVTFVLAAAAAVMAGDGRAAAAVGAAGQDATMRSFFRYTRTQEGAADQFAVTTLDDTGTSSRGMLEFFQILEGQEFLVTDRQDPYVRTHPLTQSRISFVRNHVANSPYSDAPLPAKYGITHRRMRAKLIGFLEPTGRVMQTYKATDNSVESRYARAIALHRESRTDDAVGLVDSLIAEQPNDPYFHELKGQILFESGRIKQSLGPYGKAVRLAPNEALLRSSLGAAQLESNDPALVRPALTHIKEAVRKEPDMAHGWRLLATAHGRLGQKGLMTLALAEEAAQLNRNPDALRYAKRASATLKKGSPAWIRAQDIAREAEKAVQRDE
ncbi:MAG: M48 family metalloprotease [Alphaproteobacteria bacterium]|nr:M48 family metalloprotease [Alphaproteobacteria bacterium]